MKGVLDVIKPTYTALLSRRQDILANIAYHQLRIEAESTKLAEVNKEIDAFETAIHVIEAKQSEIEKSVK